MTRPLKLVTAALVALLAVPPVTADDPTGVGWVPANSGVMWWQPSNWLAVPPQQPPGELSGSWWLTRRIGVSPHLPEVQHLGSLLHGLYVSAGGGAWVNVTPGCLLPMTSPVGQQPLWTLTRNAVIALTGLDACGIEGIAYDPVLPNRVYVSAYKVESVSAGGLSLAPGGVYASDTGGLTWRKLTGDIRGNGLAVARAGVGPARIVVGAIQEGGSVGQTPGGGSLKISDDDGSTWRNIVLPPSGCTDDVPRSQRITPTIAMRPTDPSKIYVGTNAGLYYSGDGGASFTFHLQACNASQASGGTWGVALSADGARVWVGDHQGRILTAPAGSTSFTQLADLGSGKVQSLLLDPHDRTGRRLFAAVWDGGDADVYRIDGVTGASSRVGGSILQGLDRLDQLLKPFPLVPAMRSGVTPSLFLARPQLRLEVSTVFRGVFTRIE